MCCKVSLELALTCLASIQILSSTPSIVMKTMVDFDGEDLSEPIVEVLLACWMLWEVNQDICEPKDQGRYIDGVANFAFVQMILALKSFIDAAAAFSFLIVTKDHATRMHLLSIIPYELYEGLLKIYYAYIAWSYVMTTSHPEQVGFGHHSSQPYQPVRKAEDRETETLVAV